MRCLARSILPVACALLVSCAGYRAYEQGRDAMVEGDSERSLAKLEEAVKASPNNYVYRDQYERQKTVVIGKLLSNGDLLRSSGDLAEGPSQLSEGAEARSRQRARQKIDGTGADGCPKPGRCRQRENGCSMRTS
jgi:hypothetical protein